MKLRMHGTAYKNILAGITVVACVLLFYFFPSYSINPVWKGYRFLAVPLEQDEKSILTLLEKNNITDLVTESNSRIKNTSEKVPIQPFLEAKNEALSPWFRNDSEELRYIYIAEAPFLESRIQKAFSSSGFSWFFEKADGMHILPIALVVVFFAITVFLSQYRLFLLATGWPFILYAARCNQFPAFLASLLSIYGLFVASDLFEPGKRALSRKMRRKRFNRHPETIVPAILAFFSSFSGKGHSFRMLPVAFALSGALFVLFSSLQDFFRQKLEQTRLHPSFTPEPMHPGSVLKKWPGKNVLYALVPIPVLCVSGFFLFGTVSMSESRIKGSGEELYIPSPSGYTSRTGFDSDGYTEMNRLRQEPFFPDLGWFLAVRWNLETAPWRRVQTAVTEPEAGSIAEIMEFTSDENAILSGKKETMYIFNDSFIKKTLSGTVTPLEKMLLAQGRYVTVNLERHSR